MGIIIAFSGITGGNHFRSWECYRYIPFLVQMSKIDIEIGLPLASDSKMNTLASWCASAILTGNNDRRHHCFLSRKNVITVCKRICNNHLVFALTARSISSMEVMGSLCMVCIPLRVSALQLITS